MSFKAFHEIVAEKLTGELKNGTSPFQLPRTADNRAQFHTPVNPTTGIEYRGLNALWLGMQDRDDPRWMTLNHASANKMGIEKGAKGTLINFAKTTDLSVILDDKGNKVMGKNGKPKTELVQLEKPLIVSAFVFNADQVKGISDLATFREEKAERQQSTPIERLDALVDKLNITVTHGAKEPAYDPVKDVIRMPDKKAFPSTEQYYVALLHEVAHATAHPDRLNRSVNDNAKESLKVAMATLVLGSKFDIGHDPAKNAPHIGNWAVMLKDTPFELHKAASDAQKIVDFVTGAERKIDVKQEAGKGKDNTLALGDLIAYRDTDFKVVAELKGKTLQVEDLTTGEKTKVHPKDGLYQSLLQAKNNPQERAAAQSAEIETTATVAAEPETGYKRKR